MKQCATCEFFIDQQPGRPRGKGTCYFFPEAVKTTSDHWCGQHKPKEEAVLPEKETDTAMSRQQLMKALKASGKKVDVKMSKEEMQAELDKPEVIETVQETTTEA